MSNYTAKHINDMEAAFGGGFVKARAELGVTSFGMQVIRMPADYGDYPELLLHALEPRVAHVEPLVGRVDLAPDMFVRVAGGVKRKVHAGPEGLQMLVLGGCPGQAYEIPEMTELSVA